MFGCFAKTNNKSSKTNEKNSKMFIKFFFIRINCIRSNAYLQIKMMKMGKSYREKKTVKRKLITI